MKMRAVLIVIISTFVARAELIETTLEWVPACDGATIEVIMDAGKIQGVRAFAAHSAVIREWTIHFVGGLPVTAEYRERKRGKIMEGDRAGEDSGENLFKKLQTFRAIEGKFVIGDKNLADDLAGVLAKVKTHAEPDAGGKLR